MPYNMGIRILVITQEFLTNRAEIFMPKGLGSQNLIKKLAHVGVLLGHLLSQNRVPKLSDSGPPPPLKPN